MPISILFTLLLFSSTQCTIILKPLASKPQTQEAVFVLTQGANIPSQNYKLFAQTLQQNYNGKLWIALLTGFPFNLPEPMLIRQEVDNAVNDLLKAGCKIDKTQPFFFAGHSLGGLVIQDFVFNDTHFANNFPGKFSGLILEGSYVLRKNRAIAQTLSQSILTIGGELDGLCRITRMAESFYFNSQSSKDMTLIVSGMNHYQFVGDGQEPSFVLKHDLHAEMSNEHALNQVTQLISDFMTKTLGSAPSRSLYLSNQLNVTTKLIQPLIDAFNLEGFYHFKPPCNGQPSTSNCRFGSGWTERAQKLMSLDNITSIVTDAYHPVYQIPVHLPAIHNNCSVPYGCTLNVTTVTQNEYILDDSFDNALGHVAASEIRAKLMSNQSMLMAATGVIHDFNETDGASLCQLVNANTIDEAILMAPQNTLLRYQQKGKKLVSGADKVENAGPLWIWQELEYKNAVDEITKQPITMLHSISMKFPVDYKIKLAAGFHYCKLLSPARALEWIYIDSLKN